MEQSIAALQAGLLRDYYKWFSKYAKGKKPDKKVAWVTSFAPVEILEALDIYYYYPESYAAVIAASGKEQPLLEESENEGLSRDCCSYSCCIEGCLVTEKGPRGVPPTPDILIATNNQCNTLPNWWNILAKRFNVPLVVIDYPGEMDNKEVACSYVNKQHKELITILEELSGNKLDMDILLKLIDNSVRCTEVWKEIIKVRMEKNLPITTLFDDISFLITSRCKPETEELYRVLLDDLKSEESEPDDDKIKAFWTGYPLWYHPNRHFDEALDNIRITGSNYITWWILDYSGDNAFEKLFNAYNYTFLNLSQKTRNSRLKSLIEESGAVCTITLHNKSCKCDYISARNIEVPQAEIEMDMVDREFLKIDGAELRIDILRENLCIK